MTVNYKITFWDYWLYNNKIYYLWELNKVLRLSERKIKIE